MRLPSWLSLFVLTVLLGCGEAPDVSPGGYDASGRLADGAAPAPGRPSFVVVVIDSLRADADLPAFSAWAGPSAVRFTEATASAPWTLPSMTSLFTGRLPSRHGLRRMEDAPTLLPDVTTYAEVLRESGGYDTAAFVSGPWFRAEGRSVLQGFDTIGYDFSLQAFDADFEKWVRFRDPSRPFLLLLHAYEAHVPYGPQNHPHPPRPRAGGKLDPETIRTFTPKDIHRTLALDYDAGLDLEQALDEPPMLTSQRYAYRGYAQDPDPELAAELRAAYDEGVAWMDGLLARTLDRLEKRGLLRNAVVVLTSDHGETFGENGTLGHGLQLHDELLRVPLVVRGPAPFDEGGTVDDGVGLIDLMPTFLDIAGLPPLEDVEGRSLLGVLDGTAEPRGVLAEEWLDYANTGTADRATLLSARTPSWKYVARYDRASGAVEERAYDLLRDPGEQNPLPATDARFDPAACRAVERIRDELWGLPGEGREQAITVSVPYATRAATAAGARPRPCGSERR